MHNPITLRLSGLLMIPMMWKPITKPWFLRGSLILGGRDYAALSNGIPTIPLPRCKGPHCRHPVQHGRRPLAGHGETQAGQPRVA